MQNKIVCVVGPTASGKTKLAAALAHKLSGEVVSADSMQIYKRMDIGTAKPTEEEKSGIPHHMIDVAEPWESYSAARYVDEATRICDDILSRRKLPIVAGGTGLYVDNLVRGTDFAETQEDLEYRKKLFSLYEKEGAEKLHKMLEEVDPQRAGEIHPNNVKRVIRALEVYSISGKPISRHDEETRKKPPKYDAVFIGLCFSDREKLYERINLRVDRMFDEGLEEEVRKLLESGVSKDATSMQAIGYKELADFIAGKCGKEEAKDAVKQATRRYAKRQMTWFKRNKNINWIDISKTENFSEILQNSINFVHKSGI